MNRAKTLLRLAIFMYALAWFLPVIKDGTTLAQGGVPGWEALVTALSPIWDSGSGDTWWEATLAAASGLTNAWFLIAVVGIRTRRLSKRLLVTGLLLAALINTYWLAVGLGNLRVGYYLWAASYWVLAAAVVERTSAA